MAGRMLKPKPIRRFEQVPHMTIVAGFPGNGFVVLAADSEEGGGIAKSSVHKIALVDKGNCKCLIGGAGHGDFIDLAVQHVEEQLSATADIKTARIKLEAVVTDIYAKRIDLYPEHQRDDLTFELLCAVWSKKDVQPRLVRVRRSANLVRRSPEAIGIGTYLARYLIATLGSTDLSLIQTFRLATYVIAQAKKYVTACGGSTQVMSLGPDGSVIEMPNQLIAQNELSTALIVEDMAKIIFYATDPFTTGLDGEKMRVALEAGIALWATQLPVKLIGMMGIPPALIAQQQAAAVAKAEQTDQSNSPTNSSMDQT
jgi:20S proteasome alpha/beta subunit